MTAPWPGRRRAGLSLVEILVAVAVLALAMLPVIDLYTGLGETAAVSEDAFYAELLAARIVERYTSLPFESLLGMEGRIQRNVLAGLFDEDAREDWFDEFPSYGSNLGIGKGKFKAEVEVCRLDEGLLSIEALVRWRPSARGARLEGERSYALIAFKCRKDGGTALREGEADL